MRQMRDFGRHFNGLPPQQRPRTALTDVQHYLEPLSKDERQALDQNEKIVLADSTLKLNFLNWLLNHTHFGHDFCANEGSDLAENLLKTVMDEHKALAGQEKARTQGLEELVKEQQKMMLDLQGQLDRLKSDLGE